MLAAAHGSNPAPTIEPESAQSSKNVVTGGVVARMATAAAYAPTTNGVVSIQVVARAVFESRFTSHLQV